jgi:hypothetical protein
VIDVCTHTSVEEGGDEGLSGLSDDVIVEVLVWRKSDICAMTEAVLDVPPIEIGPPHRS